MAREYLDYNFTIKACFDMEHEGDIDVKINLDGAVIERNGRYINLSNRELEEFFTANMAFEDLKEVVDKFNRRRKQQNED